MERQVPGHSNPTYALIGSGALAKHWAFYLKSKNIHFTQWSRKPLKEFNTFLSHQNLKEPGQFNSPHHSINHSISLNHTQLNQKLKTKNLKEDKTKLKKEAFERLKKTLEPSSHVLLLISDKSIAPFLKEHPLLLKKVLIHCSGALSLPEIQSVHPVMSFTHVLFRKSFYEEIFFVTEKGKDSFQKLFPKLKNPSCSIDKKLKPLYHSYLVLSGNLSSFLWGKIIEKMKTEFSIPQRALHAYLKGISKNLKANYLKALTGPLVRGEQNVIQKHEKALKGSLFEGLYREFLKSYFNSKKYGDQKT